MPSDRATVRRRDAVEVGRREPWAVIGGDSSVHDAVRQAHEVAREPMAAEVGAFPDPLGVLGGQRGDEGASAQGAAGVALAIRADQEDRVAKRRTELG